MSNEPMRSMRSHSSQIQGSRPRPGRHFTEVRARLRDLAQTSVKHREEQEGVEILVDKTPIPEHNELPNFINGFWGRPEALYKVTDFFSLEGGQR